MQSKTTIKLDRKTKFRLDKLKMHKRESYDEILNKIINILNTCKVNPEKAKIKLKRLDRIKELSRPSERQTKPSLKASNPQRNPQSS